LLGHGRRNLISADDATRLELAVGTGVLAVVPGEITTVRANAAGNAANSALAGGGVDGAIQRAGGPVVMDELP
jgi:hypothetical protein